MAAHCKLCECFMPDWDIMSKSGFCCFHRTIAINKGLLTQETLNTLKKEKKEAV